MEKVILVSEENHGVILVAMNEEAAKRALLETGWVDMYTSVWIPDGEKYDGRYEELIDLYGENWEEAYKGFSDEQMENMGFHFKEVEIYD